LRFGEVVRGQQMVRAFAPEPVAADVMQGLLTVATSGPSAGFSQGLELVVLQGPDQTARYWDASLPAEARATFPWPRLLDADVLVVLFTRPDAYVARYGEVDKASTGLGALFFGIFRRIDAIKAALGAPPEAVPVGVIAVGHPLADRPSRSAERGRRSIDDVVHRGRW
jgi:nitroreductase